MIHGLLGRIGAEPLAADPESRRVFLPGGKPPASARSSGIPISAKALRLIADQGAAAFYKGDIARAILRHSSELAAPWPPDDLAEFSAEWVQPDLHHLSRLDRLRTAAQRPGHGRARNAEHHGDFTRLARSARSAPSELHKQIEAMKLAYADLHRYNADPRFAKVPVNGLLSKDYAQRASQAHRSAESQLRSRRRHVRP